MQTRVPVPVEPPHAHSRVTRSGQWTGSEILSTASFGRLHAGSASPACAASEATTLEPTSSARGVALAQLVDEAAVRLETLLRQRGLEIGDESSPESRIGLRARDDLVERATSDGELLCGLHPGGGSGPQQAQEYAQPLLSVSERADHLFARRPAARISSLEPFTKLHQAARDAACDRSSGDRELGGDGPVALVSGEEAVEYLLAGVGQRGHCFAHGERLVDLLERLLPPWSRDLLRRLLARTGRDGVETQPSRELRDPGPERGVVHECVELRVDAREDLLEDVLGVLLPQAEALNADRVHVAREALDELVPSRRIAFAAALDELRVGEGRGHGRMKAGWSVPRNDRRLEGGC